MSKRRLELMPEVLPDPTPHYDTGAPRKRTLDHLERLRSKRPVEATVKALEDGALELRLSGRAFAENPPPFGYGLAFVRIESCRDDLVLRLRPLPEVPVVSLVVAAVPKRISVKLDTRDLAVTANEVDL